MSAAETVAAKLGAAHLTLDAVAAQAKLSKGGLLYHFRDKDQLLQALVDRYKDKLHESFEAYIHTHGDDLRTLLKGRLACNCQLEKNAPNKLHHALVAACANNPAFLEPAREGIQATHKKFVEGFEDPTAAVILLLASHGLTYLDVLQISPLSSTQRKAVLERIMAMADNLAIKNSTREKPMSKERSRHA